MSMDTNERAVGRGIRLSAVMVLLAALMAVGGAAYLVSQAIKSSRVVGFPELGMEAIYEFELEDMPVAVAVDSRGESVHQTGPKIWAEKINQLEVQFNP